MEIATDVFGIVSPAWCGVFDCDSLKCRSVSVARLCPRRAASGSRHALPKRERCGNKQSAMSSQAISAEIGGVLLDAFPVSPSTCTGRIIL